MDKRFGYFESALQAAYECAENPIEESIEKAKRICVESIVNILAIPAAVSKLDSGGTREAMRIGVNLVDYNVPFNYALYYKNDNIKTLALMIYFLNHLPATAEGLKYVAQKNQEFHIIDRQIQYLGINELFCRISGEEIEAFYKGFLKSLVFLSADKLAWEKDGLIIEAKVEKLFADMESGLESYSEFAGKQYKSYLSMKKDVKGIMSEIGYSLQERDRILEEMEMLSEQVLYEQQKL